MSEEASGTQVANGSQAGSSAEQGAQTEQTFIGADGKFSPGWKEHYIPEEMRADKVFDTFDDVGGGLKMLGSLQSMIGKKGVIIPGEASPETEWDNYFRAKGRPDTKDQFQMKTPDDLVEHYNENLIAKARDMFWKLGFNQKEVDALCLYEEERTRAGLKAVADAKAKAFSDMETALKEKWGSDYEPRLHLTNRVISENTENQEEKEALLDVIGNNPIVGNFIANIGSKFKEHRIITDVEQLGGMTPGEAMTKAKELELTPGFILPDEKGQLLRDVNRPEYDRLEKERTRLYELANPELVKKPG